LAGQSLSHLATDDGHMPDGSGPQPHILQLVLEQMQLQGVRGHLRQFRLGPGHMLREGTRTGLDGALLELEESLRRLDARLSETGAGPETLQLLRDYLRDSGLRLPPWPQPYLAFLLHCGDDVAAYISKDRPNPPGSSGPDAL